MTSGYSKTPLERKLGLKDGFSCKLINAPTRFIKWFHRLDLELTSPETITPQSFDFVQLFVMTEKDLETQGEYGKDLIKKDGMLWVCWPKGKSKLPTELNREAVRTYMLAQGLVDVKVAAIDENWSGLKFVYRLKDRD